MAATVINETTPHTKNLVNYIRTLPFAEAGEAKKKSFAQASAECNAVSVKEFTDELRRQIDEHFDKHA